MKILLLGSSGQVGWELRRSLAPLGEVLSLNRDSSGACGDLAQPHALVDGLQRYRPDVVVNAAAYTAVDQAEKDADVAHLVNASAPAALARACQELGALLVHYSTDYVFDGTGEAPWTESSVPAPLNVYGLTKWAGEQAIVASGCDHLIFRTSWVYAARGGNFAKTMLRLAKERETLRVIDDQFGAPTGADLIADVTAHAIRVVKTEPHKQGLYHLAASGVTTWHGYAVHVIERAQSQRPDLDWRVKQIEAVDSAAFTTAATRPLNSRLDTQRLQQAFGLSLPPWQAGVDRMLDEIND